MNIGVLSLQGGVIEHLNQIKKSGHTPIEVKDIKDLQDIQGLILPGGESTTIGNILKRTGLKDHIVEMIKDGLPVYGTCAGMILLAKELENDGTKHLGVMDICVKRNGFGRQINSFKKTKIIPEISNKPLELIFIRAPYITKVSDKVKILLEDEGKILAASQDNMFVTSFHAELTDSIEVINYFINNFVK